VAVNFTWAKSTFDLSVVSAPKIEIALKGSNFKDGKSLDVTTSPYSMTNKQLNTLLLSLGAIPNEVNQVEVRLRTAVGTASYYSSVVTLAVTPYILGPIYNYTDLYLVGDATAAGWDNSATNAKLYPLQKTATAGVYSYTGYFAAGGFKLIQTPGSWDIQYGLGASAGSLLAKFDKLFKGTTLRVYGAVNNAFVITNNYIGQDPENFNSIDANFYPRPRIYTFGVNLDF